MKGLRLALCSAVVIFLFAAAAPLHGQRVADLPSGPALAAFAHRESLISYVSAEGSVLTSEHSRRWSATRYTLTGALAGAVLGSILFFVLADEECRTPESMCGLGLPLYAGAGALAGGATGFILSITTR